MAFTDNCDLYGALNEDGINRVIWHIMRQRPSLFNYATAALAENRRLWCHRSDATEDVYKYANPLFKIVGPLPLLGANAPPLAIDFIAQLTNAKIDFHPGNTIALPDELAPPLREQHLALHFRFCAAIGCPPQQMIDQIPVPRDPAEQRNPNEPPIVLSGPPNCVCLDVFATGHVERQFIGGREALLLKLDDMDIVDIKPEALEENIICYLKTTVNAVLREKLTIALRTFMFSFPLFGLATVNSVTPPKFAGSQQSGRRGRSAEALHHSKYHLRGGSL